MSTVVSDQTGQQGQGYAELRAAFSAAGQEQVFAFYDELSEEAQQAFLEQLAGIDLAELSSLAGKLEAGGAEEDYSNLQPASFEQLPENGGDSCLWADNEEIGETALRAGRVAAFTVAGGQGTRLGFAGPKGSFPVTPVREFSLFGLFAEKILAASRRYGVSIPWYVMTSQINHQQTLAFFEENGNFGLSEDQLYFFSQGLMPAVDKEGKILLADKGEVAMSPDGHGGSLRALQRSGALERMKKEGQDIISYFQVDNPLVRFLDPAFIGFHISAKSQLSSKALPKAYAAEKVGVFCQQKGRACVVEYSDLPAEYMEAVDEQGQLLYRGGSIAIHLFDRDFVEELGSQGSSVALPFHVAHKKVPYLDQSGQQCQPEQPNAYKFELFVFDALPFAENPVIIETAREDDFSPVKNAEGVDSPQSSKEDQLRQYARWAQAAGVDLEVDETGLPAFSFEISPLFALDEKEFVAGWAALEQKPELEEGTLLI